MKKVLFVCTENAGRSQMSEAYFNKYKKEGWVAESAGTIPAKEINPTVIEALKEDGIMVLQRTPTLFDPALIGNYDRVISYGCLVKEFFSAEVQAKIEEWEIEDPNDKSPEEVRTIRNIVKGKVLKLIEEL